MAARPEKAATGAWLRRTFYTCLSVVAAHTFLLPFILGAGMLVAAVAGPQPWAPICVAGVVAAYALTYNGDQLRLGRRWPAFVRLWLPCHDYFPVTTLMWDGKHYSAEPNAGHRRVFGGADASGRASKQFVFGIHPHGPVPLCASMLIPQLSRWEHLGSTVRYATASAVFPIPIARDFYMLLGCVDAGRKTCEYVLQRGLSLAVLPGGIEEQLLIPEPNTEPLVLRKRRGFVRLALKAGAALVPVFGFGERRGYTISRACLEQRRRLWRNHRIGFPLFHGRWFSLMPFARPVTLVVGKPIEVAKVPPDEEPSDELVEDTLQQYIAAVQELYEEHKVAAGYADVELIIR